MIIRTIIIVLFLTANQCGAVSLTKSRTCDGSVDICVAPVSVFFYDADGVVDSSTAGATKPMHDYHYAWDFDDSNSGAWGTTGASKNADIGPMTAHVFEEAGTYTVSLSVREQLGGASVGSDTATVVVTDADTYFSGTNTTCMSSVSQADFVGCPSGATQVTTDDITSITSYVGTGKRVLLHRGSSWDYTGGITNIAFNTPGPMHIGAYGSCATPTSQGICSNAPLISINSPNIDVFNLYHNNDIRITDISFTTDGTTTSGSHAVHGSTDFQDILLLRLYSEGLDNVPFMWTHWRDSNSDKIKNMTISDCYVKDSENMNYYIGSENLAFIGNIGLGSELTHVSRVWWSYKGVISHNFLSGSSYTTTSGRHALKFHGPQEDIIGTYSETGGEGLPYRSTYTVISNNVFGSSGPWPVSIGPQDSFKDERLSDIIFERNKVLAEYGIQSPTLVSTGLMFEGRYITARNNVIDGTGGSNNFVGIDVARRGLEWPPLGNRVFNNTIYNSDNITSALGIRVHIDANDTIIRNNLVSFPNETAETLITDHSGTATTSNNVLTGTPNFTDPNISNPLSRDFSLTASSTAAIDQGASVPVYDDFDGTQRTGTFDIGAYSYSLTSTAVHGLGGGTAAHGAGGGVAVH